MIRSHIKQWVQPSCTLVYPLAYSLLVVVIDPRFWKGTKSLPHDPVDYHPAIFRGYAPENCERRVLEHSGGVLTQGHGEGHGIRQIWGWMETHYISIPHLGGRMICQLFFGSPRYQVTRVRGFWHTHELSWPCIDVTTTYGYTENHLKLGMIQIRDSFTDDLPDGFTH